MAKQFYEFQGHRVDLLERAVWRGSELLPLRSKEFEVLLALIKRPNTTVPKEVLLKEVWPDVHVSEANLRKQIQSVRDKLGKSPAGRDYILTIPKQGYMLAAQVETRTENETGTLAPAIGDPPRRWARLVLGSMGISVLFVLVLMLTMRNNDLRLQRVPTGRLLAASTTEGATLMRIGLKHRPEYLAITPRGDKVFASGGAGRMVSIIRTRDNSVQSVKLPEEAGPLAISPDGERLYIGSDVEGIMVIDVAAARLLPNRIATGGPVIDMAMTPNGGKLFLAMSMKGLARLSVRSGKVDRLSERVCPVDVAIDPQGKRLYVGFQCSPGSGGHNTIEVYDPETETRITSISGFPTVANRPAISPDGELILVGSGDACINPDYDHQGCGLVPSEEFHLLHASDLRALQTFRYTIDEPKPTYFLDNSRFLLVGPSLSVFDINKQIVLERLGTIEVNAGPVVFAPDGKCAYLASAWTSSILVLPLSAPAIPNRGLAMLFAGDGTFADSVDLNLLEPHGDVRFVAGKFGESFFFGPGGFLSLAWAGYYQARRHDLSISLYVRFSEMDGERVLFDWTDQNPRRGIRLLKTATQHMEFQSWLDGTVIQSQTAVEANIWYHIVVTQSDREITLYVNGIPEASAMTGSRFPEAIKRPLFLGANSAGQASFHGWLDEIAFYNRVLSADEIRSMNKRSVPAWQSERR